METLLELSLQEKLIQWNEKHMKDDYKLKDLKRRAGKVKVEPEANKMPISIRFDTSDLSLIRDEADRLGIPYQTLISSIIHRFVTGELVDKKAISLNRPS